MNVRNENFCFYAMTYQNICCFVMNTSTTCYTLLDRIAFSLFVAWAFVCPLNQLIYCFSILSSWMILHY